MVHDCSILHLLQKTVPGQDLFIIGGRADGGPIDIRVNSMPNQFDKYNAWSQGDSQLDWKGMQNGQVVGMTTRLEFDNLLFGQEIVQQLESTGVSTGMDNERHPQSVFLFAEF